MPVPFDILTRPIEVHWGRLLLALDSSGVMAVSSDALIWTKVITYSGPILRVGAYGNGMFLASSNSPARLFKSPDGHSWTELAVNPFTSLIVRDIIYGNDRFMVVGLDVATQRIVTVATLSRDEDGNDVWSSTVTPPLSGASFGYNGAQFAAGQFFIFGHELFSDSIRQVIGYDFFLNEPIYGPPTTMNWTKSRLTRSSTGLSWGILEDPFNAIDGGVADNITFTNPAPPHNQVTVPQTDPNVSVATTTVSAMAWGIPEGKPLLVSQQTNVPAQSFAVNSGAGWQISPSESRNIIGGMAYGSLPPPAGSPPDTPRTDRYFAMGTGPSNNLGYLISSNGLAWTFQVQGTLTLGTTRVVFAKGKFVTARFLDIYYSETALSWQTIAPPIAGVTNYITIVH